LLGVFTATNKDKLYKQGKPREKSISKKSRGIPNHPRLRRTHEGMVGRYTRFAGAANFIGARKYMDGNPNRSKNRSARDEVVGQRSNP
jgi:hypothetical protein